MIYAVIAGLGAGIALASLAVWSVRITKSFRRTSSAVHGQEQEAEAEARA